MGYIFRIKMAYLLVHKRFRNACALWKEARNPWEFLIKQKVNDDINEESNELTEEYNIKDEINTFEKIVMSTKKGLENHIGNKKYIGSNTF